MGCFLMGILGLWRLRNLPLFTSTSLCKTWLYPKCTNKHQRLLTGNQVTVSASFWVSILNDQLQKDIYMNIYITLLEEMAQLLPAIPSGTPRGRSSSWVLQYALKWSCVLIAPSIPINGQAEKEKKNLMRKQTLYIHYTKYLWLKEHWSC